MNTILEKTTKTEQRLAKLTITRFNQKNKPLGRNKHNYVDIKIEQDGETFRIPKKAVTLLFEILNNMALGKSISILHSETELSTQQAADILNVSRPHIVKLLEEGHLPFKKTGTHRRIDLIHLIQYKKSQKATRNEKLDFLTKQAQELNLGY